MVISADVPEIDDTIAAVAAPVPQPLSWTTDPDGIGGTCARLTWARTSIVSWTSSLYSCGVGARACFGTNLLSLSELFMVRLMLLDLVGSMNIDSKGNPEALLLLYAVAEGSSGN